MLNTQGLPPALAAVFSRAADDQLRSARESEVEFEERDDDTADDGAYCMTCDGSGEGMWDGSRCSTCRGSGSA